MTVAQELEPEAVVGGADTHADTVHVALITVLGQDLADRQFPTTPAGYRAAVEFLYSHGSITRVGIEGTSSYGAGLCRAARTGGLQVLEVNHTTRAERRRQGKSDPLDAYRAAHAVLSGRATSAAKTEDIEGLRALRTARRSAVKARTAAANQIHQLLITAPDPIRDKFRGLSGKTLVKTLAQCRPAPFNPVTYAVLIGLKTIAQRHQYLDGQISYLTKAITPWSPPSTPACSPPTASAPIPPPSC
jgi:transposase